MSDVTDALVSGLNDWLLNAEPSDRRYKEMLALRHAIEAGEIDDLEFTITEIVNRPSPVAKGFAFDFELTENQVEQLDWIAQNSEPNDVWRQVLKYLAANDVKITYAEGGGPYAPDVE